jgi:hypothetical protein
MATRAAFDFPAWAKALSRQKNGETKYDQLLKSTFKELEIVRTEE